jgi:hypothetical protein
VWLVQGGEDMPLAFSGPDGGLKENSGSTMERKEGPWKQKEDQRQHAPLAALLPDPSLEVTSND